MQVINKKIWLFLIIINCSVKVLQMRNELAELQKAFLERPLSQRTRWSGHMLLSTNLLKSRFRLVFPTLVILSMHRHELDLASERLSVELKKLDRHVSTAVVDDITTVFADAELPVHNMIQAATAPLLVGLNWCRETHLCLGDCRSLDLHFFCTQPNVPCAVLITGYEHAKSRRCNDEVERKS